MPRQESSEGSPGAAPIVAPDDAGVARAAEILCAGGLVALPTETVYGLAADATDDAAVARIFEAKGRPRFNPLIAHVSGRDMAADLVEIDARADKLIAAFWPGPLTLVLPRKTDSQLSLLASAGLDTTAVRAPAHEAARKLIAAVDRPLAAPSANPSGAVSPTTADHVARELGGKIDLILDGGPCGIGLESTVVSLAGDAPVLLRPGGLARDEIESVIGPLAAPAPKSEIASPGMLAIHYAPRAKLRLNALEARPGEAFLGFADIASAGKTALNLSERGDLREAAANLFRHLHELDARGVKTIAVAPIPADGLGEAINDRLARAAAPRTT